MAGALMQLVAYGAQDVYLTAEPTITFWKAVYRRHTNFAMESMEQTFNGNPSFGGKVVCRVSRNGDLMGRSYVQVTLPTLVNSESDQYVNRVGFRLLKQVELRVGGQMIDRQYATWMHIWSELTHSTEQKSLLNKLVGNTNEDGARSTTPVGGDVAVTLYVPLLFAFCRHPGLALPLIALQYHEVEIQIDFATLNDCVADGTTSTGSLGYCSLWIDYIFLDTEERKEFAQKPHEYLIECVQWQDAALSGTTANSVRLTFNHPTKFITWVVRRASPAKDNFTDYTNGSGASNVVSAKLKLNGQDRFTQRDNTYFNYVQPYQHFTGKPDLGINVYSFALKPEEHQPSGSCNLSRIDNVNLDITPVDAYATALSVYALNYNVFRVASGMGGLAYSN